MWIDEHPQAELVLQAVRIGELGIAAIPNEVYGITGLKLKTAIAACAADESQTGQRGQGYIPLPEQHYLGGYTTWPARTAGRETDEEPKSVNELLTLLEQVVRRQETEAVGRGSLRRPATGPLSRRAQ